MRKTEFYNPQFLVFMAEDTFAPLFWDDEDVGIGDADSFYIGEKEYECSTL